LAEKAQALVGGPDAVLIIDDTALLKQGKRSVGVARQYAGAVGKTANCQTLVSLTLARAEVPVCVALRLFLPAEWTDDPARCRAAGVPEDRLAPRTAAGRGRPTTKPPTGRDRRTVRPSVVRLAGAAALTCPAWRPGSPPRSGSRPPSRSSVDAPGSSRSRPRR
jgi:hypothetical protein